MSPTPEANAVGFRSSEGRVEEATRLSGPGAQFGSSTTGYEGVGDWQRNTT